MGMKEVSVRKELPEIEDLFPIGENPARQAFQRVLAPNIGPEDRNMLPQSLLDELNNFRKNKNVFEGLDSMSQVREKENDSSALKLMIGACVMNLAFSLQAEQKKGMLPPVSTDTISASFQSMMETGTINDPYKIEPRYLQQEPYLKKELINPVIDSGDEHFWILSGIGVVYGIYRTYYEQKKLEKLFK